MKHTSGLQREHALAQDSQARRNDCRSGHQCATTRGVGRTEHLDMRGGGLIWEPGVSHDKRRDRRDCWPASQTAPTRHHSGLQREHELARGSGASRCCCRSRRQGGTTRGVGGAMSCGGTARRSGTRTGGTPWTDGEGARTWGGAAIRSSLVMSNAWRQPPKGEADRNHRSEQAHPRRQRFAHEGIVHCHTCVHSQSQGERQDCGRVCKRTVCSALCMMRRQKCDSGQPGDNGGARKAPMGAPTLATPGFSMCILVL